MADGAIVEPTTTAAPKDYTLTGSQEIVLKSVRAVIDGSGAGSAFLPTLQLLDPNGNVAWEGTTSDTVAAGGSADVSWFPGLGGLGASGTGAEWFFGHMTSATNVGNGATIALPFHHAEVSNSAVFTLTSNPRTNDTITGNSPGIYLVQAWQTWESPQNYNHNGFISADFFGSGGFSHTPVTDSATDATETGSPRNIADAQFYITQSVPGNIALLAANGAGATKQVTNALMIVIYLPNSVLVT